MTTALKGSLNVLAWAAVLLSTVQMMFALFINQLLVVAYFGENEIPVDERRKVFEYFGTFSRSMLSMFELTLANWPPICRLFQESVSEWCMPFIVLHKLLIGFAVIGVVNGVFMQETFKIASTDDRIMVRQKSITKEAHKKKMKALFDAADEKPPYGKLSLGEFIKTVETPYVKLWLAAMELTVEDVKNLFQLLDEGRDGYLTAEELIDGVGIEGRGKEHGLAHHARRAEETDGLCRAIESEA